ncbi:Store-operated calcium entry-associated regulatory factor [Pleurostoma richardsiae]|uniref:Store-operated calcium entry-associated regulatory factor n=1 Tax=Pleurostoma richardsiae TaxID=41990 RepID=A0AA38RFW4_9PEZI|nr:Store-operated calcium entry-associated regulatory factor [Pleurostoma richardsiae]
MHVLLLSFLYPTFFLLSITTSSAAAAKPRNAILLSEVESLTLRGDKQTTHRRVPAVPQLRCAGPPALCAKHRVDLMRCVNQGHSYDAEDVQWACKASLPPELKLGSTEVVCEGYSGPDDPYVLKGSCAVEYRLALTERGAERWPELAGGGDGWFGGGGGDTDWSAYLFGIVFVAVLAWIVWSACVRADENRRPGPRRAGGNNFWGGGGGGGWGPGGGGGGGGGYPGYTDPPPPYPGTKPSDSQGGWQPGFWSGLAGGAAAGYLAGNRNSDRRQDYNRGYGSSWGSPVAGPSRSSSGSSSGSTSASRYESTGFGSTSRR